MSGRTTDRLQDLARAMGEEIRPHNVPPLRLDAAQDRRDAELWRSASSRWTGGRWLIPAAAAAALLALVASLTAGTHLLGQRGPAQHQVKKPRVHLLPYIAPLIISGPPKFLVTWEDGRRGDVRSVSTGRVVAPIPNPASGFSVEGIGAAPGDRVFYLAGVLAGSGGEELEFYRIVLNSRGRPGPALRVAGPPVRVPTPVSSNGLTSVAVAVSLDGRELAFAPSIALDADRASRRASITVRSLVTGASRSWSVWPSPITDITQLSWARGGQLAYVATLGYASMPHQRLARNEGGELNAILVLDTTARGHSLAGSVISTAAVIPMPPAGSPATLGGPVAGVVAADGQYVIGDGRGFDGKGGALAATSVTTHKSRLVFRTDVGRQADPIALDGDNLLFTLGPSHVHPSARYVCGHLASGNIRTGKIRALPFTEDCSTAAPPAPFIASW